MSGCTTNPKIFFLTYAATRLADDIESASLKLESSEKQTKIKHTRWIYKGGEKTLRENKTIEITSIP